VKTLEDWYEVKMSDLDKLPATHIEVLDIYFKRSLRLGLTRAYPEYPWKPWRFERTLRGFWDDESNVREYLEWLAKELMINDLDDWALCTDQHVMAFDGNGLIAKYGEYC
jgi:hypothetical protein